MQCGFNHGTNLFIANPGNPSWARGIFLQSPQAQSQEAFSPKLDCWSRNIQSLGDVRAIHSVGSQLDDLCTLDKPQRHRSATRPLIQGGAFFWGRYDRACFSTHNARSCTIAKICQSIYDALH